jgi:hypothetical protein
MVLVDIAQPRAVIDRDQLASQTIVCFSLTASQFIILVNVNGGIAVIVFDPLAVTIPESSSGKTPI